jgi:translation initiation factor 1A
MKKQEQPEEEQKITRVKLPRGREVMGVIDSRVGGSRMLVNCLDKITRNCKVPGRLRRRLWLRAGDVVIVEPWEFDNSKGSIMFKYTPTQIQWLRKNGYLEEEKTEF